MKLAPAWFRVIVRVVGTVAPPLMAAITYRLFWDLGRPMALRPEATGVHARARTETVQVGDRRAVIYRWGTGARTALLVHGWRGRASQFAALIEALESPDRTIVAFDAPGNGESPGTRTDLRDYLAIIRSVASDADGLELLVGHSFGVIGAFVAVREGVRAERLVSIAGVAEIDYTVDTFARALGLTPRVVRLLRRKTERRVFGGDASIWRRFISELDPTDQTPLLVIHDSNDRTIDLSQAAKITEAHLGPIMELYTAGLGHSRVLSNSEVISTIVRFAELPVRTRSAAE